ncbi:hypothetical protein D9757_008775 [Collybiopsis confluens]|uniref:Uncharacterized protein n=1 Tax=Collybiopsis confluens TaxID=2823264 RepID=A0A8H5M195_9AGAR|nr:hypothetical protein D9757_008775 [Collybiopsis confluens]
MEIHPVSAPAAPTTPHRPPISHSTQITPQNDSREYQDRQFGPLVLDQTVDLWGLASDNLARVFYTQASRRILGYGLDQKPIVPQDLDGFLRESWMEGMHWLLMLSFVEVKHENGKTFRVGHGVRKRTREAANNAEIGARWLRTVGNGSSSTKMQKSSGGVPAPTPENTSLLPGFEGASTAPATMSRIWR